jgi:hypothetical protein
MKIHSHWSPDLNKITVGNQRNIQGDFDFVTSDFVRSVREFCPGYPAFFFRTWVNSDKRDWQQVLFGACESSGPGSVVGIATAYGLDPLLMPRSEIE